MDTVIAISQVVSTLIVALALLVGARQARHAGRQVEAAYRSQEVQGTMEVVKLITSPEMRSAARVLPSVLEVPYGQWTEEQKTAVMVRCNGFDVAGMFVRANMADEKFIVENWGASILEIREIASPLIAELRNRYRVESYWGNLVWLAGRWESRRALRSTSDSAVADAA
ncbi:DUF4760 domain-containing protein [Micromonospora sp. CA-246542]|uniref:DUF4760 domain-containing protein n=1 Tax=Micromonospora sp. CA-246542 TaxID=3239959 RepID=UPI003D9436F4